MKVVESCFVVRTFVWFGIDLRSAGQERDLDDLVMLTVEVRRMSNPMLPASREEMTIQRDEEAGWKRGGYDCRQSRANIE